MPVAHFIIRLSVVSCHLNGPATIKLFTDVIVAVS
jgi:hypothetical protein